LLHRSSTTGNSAAFLTLTGRIAFVNDRAGNFEIYVMNANGTGVTQLNKNLPHAANFEHPAHF
jgi:Tol biopolymer transport system component